MSEREYKYAGALDALIQSQNQKDTRERDHWVRVAQIQAMERLSDSIEEITAVLKARAGSGADEQLRRVA